MHPLHRILVVCADAAIVDQVGKHLSQHGFEVRCATRVGEARVCYPDWPAELIICDSGFVREDGCGRDPAPRPEDFGAACRDARMIVITEPGQTPDFRRMTQSRVYAFLGRPFKPEDLMYYIRGAMGLSDNKPNRREHNRYLFDVDTHCVLINPFNDTESRPIPALMRDVSRSGVSMIVHQLLPVPAMIKLVVHLNDQTRPIAMLAKTLSCTLTQIQHVYRLGAKFVGLLPHEMEIAIAHLGKSEALGQQTDIFMGRTFKDAVRGWLTAHHAELSAGMGQDQPSLDFMADALSANHDDFGHKNDPDGPWAELDEPRGVLDDIR
jgi:DNA-binding response OmpR family regulator